MVVSWRQVPKDLRVRLRQAHEEILKIVQDGDSPSVIKEYFGISWDDMDFHARETVERLSEFYEMLEKAGKPVEDAFMVTYVMGFLSGIRYAVDEDHEPDDN